MGVVFGDQPCIDPRFFADDCARQGLPTNWYGLPNGFLCPLGTSPGVGYLLMTRRSLDALSLNVPHDLSFDIVNETTGQASAVTLRRLLVLRTACLNPSERGDPDSCHLVRLTDLRHQHASVPIDKAYNVRSTPGSSTYYSATLLNGTTAWGWDALCQDIWNTLNTGAYGNRLGAYPGLPYTPVGTPENLRFYRGYALDALGQVLGILNCALDWNPVDDRYTIVNFGGPDGVADRAFSAHDFPERVWDTEPVEPARPRYPQYCRVCFVKTLANPDTAGGSPFYFVDVTDPAGNVSGVETGTYALVDDPMQAIYSGTSSTPDNAGALYARAQDRAREFFKVLRAGRMDRTYGAMLPDAGLRPGAQVKATWWGDTGGGYVTRVVRWPGYFDLSSAAPPALPGTPAGGSSDAPGGGGSGGWSGDSFWDGGAIDVWGGMQPPAAGLEPLKQQAYYQYSTYQWVMTTPTLQTPVVVPQSANLPALVIGTPSLSLPSLPFPPWPGLPKLPLPKVPLLQIPSWPGLTVPQIQFQVDATQTGAPISVTDTSQNPLLTVSPKGDLFVNNPAQATATVQQNSPFMVLVGGGWNPTAAADVACGAVFQVRPQKQPAGNPVVALDFFPQVPFPWPPPGGVPPVLGVMPDPPPIRLQLDNDNPFIQVADLDLLAGIEAAFIADNPTAATNNNPQNGPGFTSSGSAWNPSAAASQGVEMGVYTQPTQTTGSPTGALTVAASVNGAALASVGIEFGSDGTVTATKFVGDGSRLTGIDAGKAIMPALDDLNDIVGEIPPFIPWTPSRLDDMGAIGGEGTTYGPGASVLPAAGGSTAVNPGTTGQIPYYATGSTISGNPNLTISAGALTVGQAGTQAGTLVIAGGTSGTTTIAVQAAASGTLTLPAATTTLAGLGVAQSFTQLQTMLLTALGTSTTPVVNLSNTTAAAAGAQQVSPSLEWTGQGWETNTSASQAVQFQAYVLPVQGAANPTGVWHLQSQVNGAGFSDVLTVSSAGTVTATAFNGDGSALTNVALPTTLVTGTLGETLSGLPVVGRWRKYTIDFSNSAFIVAAATATVNVVTLPAGAVLLATKLYHTTQWLGIASVQVTPQGSVNGSALAYSTARQVSAAVADRPTFNSQNTPDGGQAHTDIVQAAFTGSGNFGNGAATNLTQGSLDVYLLISQGG